MGEVFAGRYELVDPIGRGGAGAVWRAWDQRRSRYVAAKVLLQRDAHALLRFVREQAMRIDHPHVLAPASWAADDDKVLFTMDLVRGGSLSHLVGDYGPLPPRYVCVLLDQLLAGLHAVHSEGIIHRDIKPANVLLEATGTGTPHVRLSDFGIAMRKGEPRLTEAHFVVGTPGYFAPEQMLGAEPDVPADLYAVALVALYLLGGQRPDAQAINARFLTDGTPPAPVGVPEPLWQVLAALLQPDPQARFRTATGARKALAAAVELLPEPPAGEEPVEIFDQIGPLPEGFGPAGPLRPAAAGVPPADPRPVRPQAPATPPPGVPPQPYPQPAGSATGANGAPVEGPYTPPAQPAQVPYASPATPPEAPYAQGSTPPDAPYASPNTPPPGPYPQGGTPPEAPYASSTTGYRLAPPAHPPTVPDNAGAAQQPAPVAAPPQPQPSAQPQHPQPHAPQRRPGPPRSVVIPVLVLAALCFAVGIVALAG